MTDDELLDAVRKADAALAATSAADLDAVVPTCPDWTVAGLLHHVGRIERWAAGLLRAEPGERVPYDADAPEGGAILDWFREGAGDVEAALATVDPERVVHTWAGKQPARWWTRRLAHETTMHAWDAANAAGAPPAIATTLAIDGIDELVDLFLPRRFDAAAFGGAGETVHLHTTDAGGDAGVDGDAGAGEWLLRFGPEGVEVTREHAKGDVAARGTASDLLLLLWGRAGTGALEVFGDAALLDRYRAAATF